MLKVIGQFLELLKDVYSAVIRLRCRKISRLTSWNRRGRSRIVALLIQNLGAGWAPGAVWTGMDRAGTRCVGATGRLMVLRPLKKIFLKVFWPMSGRAKFWGCVKKLRIIFREILSRAENLSLLEKTSSIIQWRLSTPNSCPLCPPLPPSLLAFFPALCG